MNENAFIILNNEKLKVEENALIRISKTKREYILNLNDYKFITLIGNCTIDYSLFNKCNEYGISLFFLTKSGFFKGYFQPDFQKNPERHINQYKFVINENKKLEYAKKIIYSKIMNQIYILRLKVSHAINLNENFIEKLIILRKALEFAEDFNKLRGIEGKASNYYFKALNFIIPESFRFTKRSIRPPEDPFNALLSFGYTLLYTKILGYVLVSGLDPLLGFLHTNYYGRASLALDLMETFRQPIIDYVVINFVNRNPDIIHNFEKVFKGIYIGSKLIPDFIFLIENRLNKKKRYNHNGITGFFAIKDIIFYEVQKFVKSIESSEDFNPLYFH